jgi:HAMP domain-containing protein
LAGASGPAPVLIVSRSVSELQGRLQQTFLLLALLAAAVVVVGGLLAYWLAGRALRPVRTIAGLARSLSERDLHRRVDVKVPEDELGELVTTFNSMLGRLEAAFEGLHRFPADASHALRAPVGRQKSESVFRGLVRRRGASRQGQAMRPPPRRPADGSEPGSPARAIDGVDPGCSSW